MIPDTEITARLKRLERDNRRLKMLGAAALVLAAVLGAIAATRPVPDKITAHELDVVDEAGRVRVKVSTTPYSASVDVLDEQGDKAATMNVFPGFSSISAGKDGGMSLRSRVRHNRVQRSGSVTRRNCLQQSLASLGRLLLTR